MTVKSPPGVARWPMTDERRARWFVLWVAGAGAQRALRSIWSDERWAGRRHWASANVREAMKREGERDK